MATSFLAPFVSIREFGAVPDKKSTAVRKANSEAIKMAQAAMPSIAAPESWTLGHPLFIPPGQFYLAEDLHITKALELFGTGLRGESILMFPRIVKITNDSLACLASEGVPDTVIEKLKSLLDKEFLDKEAYMKAIGELIGEVAAGEYEARILKCSSFRGTSLIIDPLIRGPPPAQIPQAFGANCIIRDLHLLSEEEWTTSEIASFNPLAFDPPKLEGTSKGTPGIYLQATAIIQRVWIQGFTGTGIYILAGGGSRNANGWRIHDVFINRCGGHGIHVDDGEAQGGFCTGAFIQSIGGTGIYESSFGGNTYVGCCIQVAKGRGYASDSVGNVSFIGCLAEAKELNHFPRGGVVWMGGSPGNQEPGVHQPMFTPETTAFIVEGYRHVYPFEVPNLRDPQLKLSVGYPCDQSDSTTLYAWQNNNGELGVVRWDDVKQIWATENGRIALDRDDGTGLRRNPNRAIASYVTGQVHLRGPWLQGFPTLLLGGGPIGDAARISRAAKPTTGNWNAGDVVLNTTVAAGEPLGWACTTSGTFGTYSEGCTATSDGTKPHVLLTSPSTVLATGQWISIGGTSTQIRSYPQQIPWCPDTNYTVGDYRMNNSDKIYRCITGGTSAASGATGPIGKDPDIPDGESVRWEYIGTTALTVVLTAAVLPGAEQAISYLTPAFEEFGHLTGGAGDSTAMPGNATLNTRKGRSAIAAGAAAVTITNSKVTASSVIHASLQTADATLTQLLTIVPAAGSFTIRGNGSATSNVNVGWSIEE